MANKLNRDRVCAAYNKLVDLGECREQACDMLAEVIGNGFKCADGKVDEINEIVNSVLA